MNQCVTPAISLLDRALYQAGEIELTSKDRKELEQALERMRSIIATIEKKLGESQEKGKKSG